jgi:hypothetical protein
LVAAVGLGLANGAAAQDTVKVNLIVPLTGGQEAKPDAMFAFVPGGQVGNFMKQFSERGLDKSGIRNGELYNVEFETFKDVKDAGKSQK